MVLRNEKSVSMREMQWVGLNSDYKSYIGMWMTKNAVSLMDNPDAEDIQDNS